MLLHRIIANAAAPFCMKLITDASYQTRYPVRERELRIAWRLKYVRRGSNVKIKLRIIQDKMKIKKIINVKITQNSENHVDILVRFLFSLQCYHVGLGNIHLDTLNGVKLM